LRLPESLRLKKNSDKDHGNKLTIAWDSEHRPIDTQQYQIRRDTHSALAVQFHRHSAALPCPLKNKRWAVTHRAIRKIATINPSPQNKTFFHSLSIF